MMTPTRRSRRSTGHTVADLTDLDLRYIDAAVKWYADRARQVPEGLAGYDPRILDTAYALADGDWHRCVGWTDGSVTVYNRPMW